jgi:hypothetical protein
VPTDPESIAYALAARRDDVLLTREASALGFTEWQQRMLRRGNDLTLPRGALAIPPVRDPVRTRARAVQWLLADSVVSHVTAARLHGLPVPAFWVPSELVDVTLPASATRWQRSGVRLHFRAFDDGDVVEIGGLRVTSVQRTLRDCGELLARVPFVCLVDSALFQRLLVPDELSHLIERLRHRRVAAARWACLADGRAESPSETRVRLVLGDADLLPDDLQIDVWTEGGFHVARLDMGWTRRRRKVGMEVDSAEHDRPRALYRDRDRLNALRGLEWDVRQVTADDSRRRPGYIVAQAKQALGLT